MKKIYSLFILVLTGSLPILAQPTIYPNEQIPMPGDVWKLQKFFNDATATNFDPGSSGENVTWDFSNLPTSGTLDSIKFSQEDAMTVPNGLFASATLSHPIPDFVDNNGTQFVGGRAFYSPNYTKLGEYSEDVNETSSYFFEFTQGLKQIYFPVTYNDTKNVTTSMNVNNSAQLDVTYVYKADGWGTLKLPNGTFPAFRIKRTLNISYFGTWIVAKDYEYSWYTSGIEGPICYYLKSEAYNLGGGLESTNYTVKYNNEIVTKIQDTKPETAKITCYKGIIEVVDINNIVSVDLYNVIGEKVYSINNLQQKNNISFDINNLENGCYVIKVTTEKGNISKKLLINR